MKQPDYRKLLEELAKETGGIQGDVIQDALEAEDAPSYLEDVLQHGCQSGIVSELIYYTDTKAFYIANMDEIEDLKHDMEENIGEPLKIGEPMYNWLALFGYEESARKVAEKIGLEV